MIKIMINKENATDACACDFTCDKGKKLLHVPVILPVTRHTCG